MCGPGRLEKTVERHQYLVLQKKKYTRSWCLFIDMADRKMIEWTQLYRKESIYMYDIGIIGGGTAGMTAAIYGQERGQ